MCRRAQNERTPPPLRRRSRTRLTVALTNTRPTRADRRPLASSAAHHNTQRALTPKRHQCTGAKVASAGNVCAPPPPSPTHPSPPPQGIALTHIAERRRATARTRAGGYTPPNTRVASPPRLCRHGGRCEVAEIEPRFASLAPASTASMALNMSPPPRPPRSRPHAAACRLAPPAPRQTRAPPSPPAPSAHTARSPPPPPRPATSRAAQPRLPPPMPA